MGNREKAEQRSMDEGLRVKNYGVRSREQKSRAGVCPRRSVSKGQRQKIAEFAARQGKSMNRFILDAIAREMEQSEK